jgi:hypothetical protein
MLFIFTLNLWRKKNTQALPIVVAAKTIDKEMIDAIIGVITLNSENTC